MDKNSKARNPKEERKLRRQQSPVARPPTQSITQKYSRKKLEAGAELHWGSVHQGQKKLVPNYT